MHAFAAESAGCWVVPAAHPALGSDRVHVWRIDLAQPSTVIDRLAATLAPAERDRAARFFHADVRDRWIVGRGALRAILGAYCGTPPEHIAFTYGAHGKPALVADTGLLPPQFNLAHSHDLALLAVAHTRRVGVDVERVHARANMLKIAERFFSPAERAVLRALPAEHQEAAFFRAWTRKEAYIKARGGGLAIPLHEFDVTLTPDQPPALLADRALPNAVQQWTLGALPALDGFAAAIAVEGAGWQLQTWHWQATRL